MVRLFLTDRLNAIYRRLHPGCIVLCYHRVGKITTDRWQNVVSVENFREQMRVISHYYHPMSMTHLVQSLQSGKAPGRRTIVVTFDDGYASNLRYACDILSAQNIPALFYLNTSTIDTNDYFWWDHLQRILIDNDRIPESFTFPLISDAPVLPYQTPNQRDHTFLLMHRLLKGLEPEIRNEVLERLSMSVGKAPNMIDERRPLSEADIRSLADNELFEIGGHTHSHCALSLLSTEQQRWEIQENKRILELLIGRPISHFSYPFGGAGDFDEDTIQILRQTGFVSATTTARRPVRPGDDRYTIPRISVKNWDAVAFKKKLDQLWSQ